MIPFLPSSKTKTVFIREKEELTPEEEQQLYEFAISDDYFPVFKKFVRNRIAELNNDALTSRNIHSIRS